MNPKSKGIRILKKRTMKLSKLQKLLVGMDSLAFQLPDGQLVPPHFHLTEIGKLSKQFIDCGGTLRYEEVVSCQLYSADDYDHRLLPEKLSHIIEVSDKALGGLGDLDLEVEYQGRTIEKFNLDFDGTIFLLTAKRTECLAQSQCGLPSIKPKLSLADFKESPANTPDTGCC